MPPYSSDNSHCCDGSSSSSSAKTNATTTNVTTTTTTVASRASSPSTSPSRPRKTRKSQDNTGKENIDRDLLQIAALELEAMRQAAERALESAESNVKGCVNNNGKLHHHSRGVIRTRSAFDDGSRSFPPACLSLLQSLPGNRRCIDCGEADASWASVSYGAVMCLRCSGKHRGLGVGTSYVKSLTMDSWNQTQILSMLEGGNEQLSQFFSRHKMGNDDHHIISALDRYKTKAASFYRHHLAHHARDVAEGGVYQGREASREASRMKQRQQMQQKPSLRKGSKRESVVAVAPKLCTVKE